MNDLQRQAIADLPEFKLLLQKRRAIVTPLFLISVIAYYTLILFIAFDPAALGHTLPGSVISVGIVAGMGVILLTFLVTAIYVRHANRTFQPLIEAIATHAKENHHA